MQLRQVPNGHPTIIRQLWKMVRSGDAADEHPHRDNVARQLETFDCQYKLNVLGFIQM